MNLQALIDLLSRPAAYPEVTAPPRICQTHISVVFLTDQYAYKIKKPVNLGFLDFSTLDRRHHFCDEEVRLNRRLAPEVYIGVVPVTAAGVEGAGEAVEWAVKMRRLPDEATLERRLESGGISEEDIRRLARRVAEFHATAANDAHVRAFGRLAVVARNARENFEHAQSTVGAAMHPHVVARLRQLTETALAELAPLIEARASRGVPRDTHGDLHLDHVYLFPDRPPPGDIVIIDCIEFNSRFRYADPIADAAFLAMDLKFHDRRDLAGVYQQAYLDASGDAEGGKLFPFYSAYRAAVRAKVDGMKSAETEVPEADRARALKSARAHWLLALAELEKRDARPCLVLVAGLPGSGKSTLARALAAGRRFEVVQSDRIRKELAAAAGATDIYTPQWNERTYAECLRRSEACLFEGRPVIVDANFRHDALRVRFLQAGQRLGVAVALLVCGVAPEIARQRLAARTNDVSDANWETRQNLAAEWEPLGPESARHAAYFDTAVDSVERAGAEIERLTT